MYNLPVNRHSKLWYQRRKKEMCRMLEILNLLCTITLQFC